MTTPRYKRRNFFIKKELQGRFIFRYFLLSLACVLVFVVTLGYLTRDSLSIVYDGQHLQLGQTPVILLGQVVAANWFVLVTMGLFVSLLAMLLTHRFAGPLYRFERVFEAIGQRDLSQHIVLRTKDEVKDTAEVINAATTRLSEDLRRLRTASEQLDELLRTGSGVPAVLEQAQQENRRILDLLKEYQLRSG